MENRDLRAYLDGKFDNISTITQELKVDVATIKGEVKSIRETQVAKDETQNTRIGANEKAISTLSARVWGAVIAALVALGGFVLDIIKSK